MTAADYGVLDHDLHLELHDKLHHFGGPARAAAAELKKPRQRQARQFIGDVLSLASYNWQQDSSSPPPSYRWCDDERLWGSTMVFGFLRKREVSPRLVRLRELSLLEHLNPAELRHVDVLLHEREFVQNEIIFDEGEEGQALYIILEGQVAIVRARNGEEQAIATLSPGDFFGEMALLDRAPRGARAKAASNCRMAVLFREDLAALLTTHAVVGSKITLQMARHMAQIIRQNVVSTAATVSL